MEYIVFMLFSIGLIFCLSIDLPIYVALFFGYFLFTVYGLIRGYKLKSILNNSFESLKSVSNIIIVFSMVGVITAMWRASGTIAGIITIGANFINPSIFILVAFLLNAILSILLGTSLGTAATMGVICISIARTFGINEVYTAGAVVSGIIVGDRCSPMSTAAILVATITKTDLFNNIRLMIKTTIVPFILTCIIYYFLGRNSVGAEISVMEVTKIYHDNYTLNFIVITPAILIIVMSLFRMDVKKIMLSSIVLSVIISIFIQDRNIVELLKYAVLGFQSDNAQLNEILSGGGLKGMINAIIIVSLSCSYAGIFETTHMLDRLKSGVKYLSTKITPFGAITVAAICTGMIACNQSLCSILTNQLTNEVLDDQERAIVLENTAVPIPALIPWNIANAIPLANLEVGPEANIFMFYLILLPLYNFIAQFFRRKDFYTD